MNAITPQRLANRKEYVTVARTLAELAEYEPSMKVAGFRKRRDANGQSLNTGEFFQWWDRKTNEQQDVSSQRRRHLALRAEHRCILCGKPAMPSVYQTKDGFTQYCEFHQAQQREYQRRYRSKKKLVSPTIPLE